MILLKWLKVCFHFLAYQLANNYNNFVAKRHNASSPINPAFTGTPTSRTELSLSGSVGGDSPRGGHTGTRGVVHITY